MPSSCSYTLSWSLSPSYRAKGPAGSDRKFCRIVDLNMFVLKWRNQPCFLSQLLSEVKQYDSLPYKNVALCILSEVCWEVLAYGTWSLELSLLTIGLLRRSVSQSFAVLLCTLTAWADGRVSFWKVSSDPHAWMHVCT